MMMHVVVYDVSPDEVRTRLARLLEGYGQRVQESVFECRVGEADLRELKRRLAEALRADESGSVRVYPICSDCMSKAIGIGAVPRDEGGGGLIVV